MYVIMIIFKCTRTYTQGYTLIIIIGFLFQFRAVTPILLTQRELLNIASSMFIELI